ncbi:hypothetical protein ACP70R_049820 [Stipagrostis hirtigluma subsp. patula]
MPSRSGWRVEVAREGAAGEVSGGAGDLALPVAIDATKEPNLCGGRRNAAVGDAGLHLEVPFESLISKRPFDAKHAHKSSMKLCGLRLGGIIGMKDGSDGLLTYGSYLDKDVTLMNSIMSGSSMGKKAPAAVEETPAMVKETPAMVEDTPAMETKLLTSKITENPTALSDSPNCYEVPQYVLMKRSHVRCGHKAQMSQCMIQKGGLYGEKVHEGFGLIVHGSFGPQNLEF